MILCRSLVLYWTITRVVAPSTSGSVFLLILSSMLKGDWVLYRTLCKYIIFMCIFWCAFCMSGPSYVESFTRLRDPAVDNTWSCYCLEPWYLVMDAMDAMLYRFSDNVLHKFALYSFIHSLIYSCIHSFIYSLIYSFFLSFIHSFICSFIHSCILLFIHSINSSFIHLFFHSFIYLFVHSFIHSFNHFHSFISSFIHLFIHR